VTTFDFSELNALAQGFAQAERAALPKVRGVVSKGALNVRNQMREEAGRSRHFTFASSITYDMREGGAFGGGFVEAEIGPNKRFRSARLANIAYFGGANGGGGTVPDPRGALEAEWPRFEKALGDIAEDAL
jgi:hypothetical protein